MIRFSGFYYSHDLVQPSLLANWTIFIIQKGTRYLLAVTSNSPLSLFTGTH